MYNPQDPFDPLTQLPATSLNQMLDNIEYINGELGTTITSYTDPINGGTFFYREISGVKEFWGQTSQVNVAGSGFQSGVTSITFPVGFFSSIESCTLGIIPAATIFMSANINTINSTAVSLYVWQASGTNGGAYVYMYVRGT